MGPNMPPSTAEAGRQDSSVENGVSTSSAPDAQTAQTISRPGALQSQLSMLEIDRSVHRRLPNARRASAGHVSRVMNGSGHNRRARRHASLDNTSSSGLGGIPISNISYTCSVRLPVHSFPRRGSNASSCSAGQNVAPLPTTLERAETDGGVVPAQAQTHKQAQKHAQDMSGSIRSPAPDMSNMSPTPTSPTEVVVPNAIVEATEHVCAKDVSPPKAQSDDDASVGAASARSFSSSSSSTSSEDLLLADYPRFLPSEVRLGQVLGQGSFGIVREVLAFDIDDEPQVSAKGGYRSTRSFGSMERIVPHWASSGRSMASAGRSVTSGGDDASKKSAEQAPSSVGGTSNDATSRDVITIPTCVSGGSKNGSRDDSAATPLNNKNAGGRRSSFRQPGDRADDGKERRVSISVSEIDIDFDSHVDEAEENNGSSPDHHRDRKASLGSSLGSISHYLEDRNRTNEGGKSSVPGGKQPRAKKRDSVRSAQSGISSARSIAFGIEGRTFLARHCIRAAGKSVGNNSMRRVKSQNSFRSQKSRGSFRGSLVSHGSHESAGGSDSATRNRVLARLGLVPSISSSGGSKSFFKGKKRSLLKWRGEGDCRYAVKSLRNEVLGDPGTLEMALLDLQNETRILANVEHPNIVKMRAFSAELNGDDGEHGRNGNTKDGPKGYFIVLDRLYDTLEQRIDLWSSRLQTARRPTKWITRSKVQREVWEQRLVVAYDLANALNYLHSMGIAYRDLKPQNCAFDVRGDIKLYDFGLSKELNLNDMSANGTFEPSSVVGALRYMAPEVFYGEPYNLSIDTFSFTILLWEILSLAKPYGELGLGPAGHQRQVIDGGLRPPIPEYWSEPLAQMMRAGWSDDISARPPMSAVLGTLKWELASVRDDMAEGIIQHDRRRSTFVMMKKMQSKSSSNLGDDNHGDKRRSIFRKMRA